MANNLDTARNIPPGVWLIRKIRGKDWSLKTYRYMVLLITFIAYTSYHASRKPSSIVKSVLDPEPDKALNVYPWPIGSVFLKDEILGKNKYKSEYTGWEPFNGKGGTKKLGLIDVAFLACYSLGMYGAGHLGDTLDLRLFLSSGMIGSGIFAGLFGMGYFWNIHVFGFYLVMQMVAGLFQATGWPSVVAVIGNWFGKRKRGLIMGIWNAHTSVGNITGSLLAASVLEYGWGWSFIAPGMFIALAGVLVFLFLAPYPEDVGFPCPNVPAARAEAVPRDVESQAQSEGIVEKGKNAPIREVSGVRRSVGLLEACMIPGVLSFAFCLFFAKLVAYTFLYWLPFYLSQTEIGGEYMSVKSAGNLSTLFDVGGIVGGILAGHISDKLRARAITAASFMYAAIPSMLLYRIYGSFSQTMNIVLMMIAGLFINGPYALITTAVSADLGTHSSLRGDSRALATVTAIIDGTGSIGAALGPLLTGFLSTKGWNTVFVMLMLSALIAGLLLSCQVVAEINDKTSKLMRSTSGLQSSEVPPSQPLLSEQR
ncbi:putative glycerol-3-phosphate transporter 4 [Populus alba]|uniref:Putative glycerol-3-phosphate transporter 4 n=1 Tax=Populus alba TaxID=43335 RepID=A0A4U5Q1Q1_POPAL|nr:putative glycerol-3-phosphate transporter 4 [Populus alba]XP_034932630.1 putative glycerol-3-phosphate transporter 4 [Populus alba]XP_034932631.1 putative glycerol-3-phosphate transporter 4 [Populus alba]TKS02537.1 putative glycerol-3-phosphate transporter 4 [Populus alba]